MANLIDRLTPPNSKQNIQAGDVYHYRFKYYDGHTTMLETLTVIGPHLDDYGDPMGGPEFNDGGWDDYSTVLENSNYKKIKQGTGEVLWPPKSCAGCLHVDDRDVGLVCMLDERLRCADKTCWTK